ncbi:unnamed protein product [Amoebophrya sp. A120]|nr:unnamed protein product [Amoebophrya sp. A120]|eukprot:GSA120T00005875001.1
MGKKSKKKDKGPPLPGIPRLPASHPNYVDVQLQEDNIDLTKRIETLERQLLVKKRIEENLRSSTMKTRTQLDHMQEDLTLEKRTTYAVTSDLTRQYKAMQEDLIHKINSLETTLTEQREEVDMSQHELQELVRDKNDIIRHKDRVIEELKVRMETMSTEFEQMLSMTLKSMKEHMATKLNQDQRETVVKNAQDKLEEYTKKVAATANASSPTR